MKKRKPATLYPAKEDITLRNFIIEDKQLIVLIILLIIIIFFIIGCLAASDYFRATNFYNYI